MEILCRVSGVSAADKKAGCGSNGMNVLNVRKSWILCTVIIADGKADNLQIESDKHAEEISVEYAV